MRVLRLSRVELEVLKALREAGGEATATQLVSSKKFNRSTLMSALERLASKGFVELERSEDELLELTDEGLSYVKQGLPERRLYRAASSTSSVSELRARLGMDERAFSIALGWAKRKGWVKVKRGFIEVLSAPEVDEDEEVLRRLAILGPTHASSLGASEDCVKRLKERTLISSKPWVEVKARLTAEGQALAEKPLELVEVSALTPELLRMGTWTTVKFKPYEVTAEPYTIYPGKKHPYLAFLDEVKEILISMGFVEQDGPLVETEFWNFDVLFQAQDHPAREIHDSFRVKEPSKGWLEDEELVNRVKMTHESGWATGSSGWRYRWRRDIAERLVLRTQTTAVSMRYLASHPKPPVRMFCLSRVYRPDVLDAKHSMEFMQLEGIYGDHGVTLRHLLGVIEELASALRLGEVKFKPGYFPFTEPSVEGFIKHPALGWIEFVGAGMFRPEVLIPLGVEYPVAAWGIGIERLAMVALGIDDIRELYTRRLDWLRSRPVTWRGWIIADHND